MPHNSTGSESVTNHLKCGCMGLGLVIRGEEVWGCLKAVKVVLFGLCNTLSSLVLCSDHVQFSVRQSPMILIRSKRKS